MPVIFSNDIGGLATCDWCGCVFPLPPRSGRGPSEEVLREFGGSIDPGEKMAVVCPPCWEEIKPSKHPEAFARYQRMKQEKKEAEDG